jgi:hypothetical protein
MCDEFLARVDIEVDAGLADLKGAVLQPPHVLVLVRVDERGVR